MNSLLTVVYLIAVPWAVVRLSKRWTWIDKISPMTVLYIIGLAVANLIPDGNPLFNIDQDIIALSHAMNLQGRILQPCLMHEDEPVRQNNPVP